MRNSGFKSPFQQTANLSDYDVLMAEHLVEGVDVWQWRTESLGT